MQQRILVFSADTPRFGGCVGVGKSLRMRVVREAVTERRSMPRAVLTWMHRPSTVSQKRSRGRMVYGASHEERIRFRVKNKVRFATIFPGAPSCQINIKSNTVHGSSFQRLPSF